jgi:hypothetical protein
MVSRVVVGGSHTILSRDSKVYFSMMVIISIFVHKGISAAISHKIHFLSQKDPTMSNEQIICQHLYNCTESPVSITAVVISFYTV